MFAFRTAKPKGIELFVAFLGFALLEPVFMRLLKLQNANMHMNPPYWDQLWYDANDFWSGTLSSFGQ